MSTPLGSNYELDALLGTGGMGEVWRGRDRKGNAVAVKLLRAELAGDQNFVARFIQERSVLQGIRHPNVVEVRDLVVEGDTIAIVMDLVEGGDLRAELVHRGTFPPAEALGFVAQVFDGLAAVHANGVVHRDVKPENVLLDLSGEPIAKVTDFGVSRLLAGTRLTRQTSVIGTPEYMSPEQARGTGDITVAADLYATGIMLYELLVGLTPFSGAHPVVTLRRHLEELPGRPEGLSDPVWEFLATLFAKDPGQRGPSAAAAAEHARLLSIDSAGLPALRMLDEAPPTVPMAAVAAPTLQTKPAAAADASSPTHSGVTTSAPPKETAPVHKSRKKSYALLALLVILLGGGGTAFALAGSSSSSHTSQKSSGPAPGPVTSSASETSSPSPTPTLTSMPNFVGGALADAQQQLATAGVGVKVVDQLDETKTDGTVLKQSPAAGASLDGTATMTVARQPVIQYLADMSTVDGNSSNSSTVNISGQPYPHSLSFDTINYTGSSSNSSSAEYDLGRHYRRLRATLGLSDDSYSGTSMLYEIFADQRLVYKTTLGLGVARALDLDVTSVLRLQLRVTRLDPPDNSNNANEAHATFGTARLLGVQGEVPEPSASPS